MVAYLEQCLYRYLDLWRMQSTESSRGEASEMVWVNKRNKYSTSEEEQD